MKNVNNVNKTKSKNCFKLIVVKINNQINKERNFRKIVISFITIASIVFTISGVYGASDPTLVNKINSLGKTAKYIPDFNECSSYVKSHVNDNDIVITLGAGTVTKIGPMLVD